jgi:hypothetical protein
MKGTAFHEVAIKNNFAVAQVALYLFAVLQLVAALMTATGAVHLGTVPQASTMQRVSTTTNAVVSVLCFTVGYALLAWCLDRCTRLMWSIGLGTFLINAGVTALAIAAQPNPYPILTCSLAIAGAISVWNGRGVVRRYADTDLRN